MKSSRQYHLQMIVFLVLQELHLEHWCLLHFLCQLASLNFFQCPILAHLGHHWMVVLHIYQRHLVAVRLDASLTPHHRKLCATPVDDTFTAYVSIKHMLLVAQLTGTVFGLDEHGRERWRC